MRRLRPWVYWAVLWIWIGLGFWSPVYAQETPSAPLLEQQRFADGLFSRGLLEMALDEYQSIEKRASGYEKLDEVVYRMGECFRRLRRYDAADRAYLRIETEFPDSEYRERAAFRRAEILVRTGRLQEAILRLRRLSSLDLAPDLAASVKYYAGFAYKRLGLTEEAARAFEGLLQAEVKSPFKGFAAIELAAIRRAQSERLDTISDLYTLVVEGDYSDRLKAEALFQYGDYLYERNNYAEAAEKYRDLRTQFPEDARSEEAALQTGWSWFHAGEWDALLRLAQPRSEESAPWAYLAAHAHRKLDQPIEAMRLYSAMLNRYPDHRLSPYARYEEALCAFEQNALERVIFRLNQGTWPSGLHRDRIWMLGQTYLKMGDPEKAEQALIHYLEFDATGPRAVGVMFELARLLQQRGALEEAGRLYRQIGTEFPDSESAPQSLLAAGSCAAAQADYRPAIEDWEQLISRYPDSTEAVEATLRKALAELKLERKEEARASLEQYRSYDLNPAQLSEGWFWTGRAEEALNDSVSAEAAYRHVLSTEEAQRKDAARLRLAALLHRTEREAEAADLYMKLIADGETETLDPGLLEWLTRFLLEQDRADEAVQSANVLLSQGGEAAWSQIAFVLRGRAYEVTGDSGLAESSYRNALELPANTPERLQAGLRLAELLSEQERVAEARGVLEQVIEDSSRDDRLSMRARATYLLAGTYEDGDEPEQAARYYLSVGLLYDEPDLSPEALKKAEALFRSMDRTREADEAAEEYRVRYGEPPDEDTPEDAVASDTENPLPDLNEDSGE